MCGTRMNLWKCQCKVTANNSTIENYYKLNQVWRDHCKCVRLRALHIRLIWIKFYFFPLSSEDYINESREEEKKTEMCLKYKPIQVPASMPGHTIYSIQGEHTSTQCVVIITLLLLFLLPNIACTQLVFVLSCYFFYFFFSSLPLIESSQLWIWWWHRNRKIKR